MESNCNNLEVEELNTRTGTLSREHQPSFPVATLTGSAIHQQVLIGWGGGVGGEELWQFLLLNPVAFKRKHVKRFCDVNIHLTENILDTEVLTQDCYDRMTDMWFPVMTVLCAASRTMDESEQDLILTPSRFQTKVWQTLQVCLEQRNNICWNVVSYLWMEFIR